MHERSEVGNCGATRPFVPSSLSLSARRERTLTHTSRPCCAQPPTQPRRPRRAGRARGEKWREESPSNPLAPRIRVRRPVSPSRSRSALRLRPSTLSPSPFLSSFPPHRQPEASPSRPGRNPGPPPPPHSFRRPAAAHRRRLRLRRRPVKERARRGGHLGRRRRRDRGCSYPPFHRPGPGGGGPGDAAHDRVAGGLAEGRAAASRAARGGFRGRLHLVRRHHGGLCEDVLPGKREWRKNGEASKGERRRRAGVPRPHCAALPTPSSTRPPPLILRLLHRAPSS